MIDKEKLVEFCRDLIQIPSPPGKEKEAVRRAQEEMLALGFDDCDCDDYGNVLGIIRNGEGPVIVFDAHVDTVGAEPIEEWAHDPFGGWIEEDRIFGRGATDMKGSAAAIVYGLATLLEQRKQFSGTVIACLSTLEEVCEGVALGHVIENFNPDYIVIGEASDLRLIRGQRGRVEIALTTQGVPAHSSTPHLGVDAVAKMATLIGMMNEMQLPSHDFLGSGVQALTDIISSPYPAQSTVPAKCRTTFDRRLVVGEDESSIAAELHDMIEKAKAADPEINATAEIVTIDCQAYTDHKFSFRKFIPAWEMPEDHEFVRAAAGALESAGLGAHPPDYYRFCTNGSWACVHAGLPTVGFGPGNPGMAHRVDEYVEINQLEAAARGYAAMALEITK
jgi:putative selenium metabolism hydrolase